MVNSLHFQAFKKTLQDAQKLNTDLLEMSEHADACSLCKQYEGRVFSISGKDTRFPKLPEIVLKTGGFHEGCKHNFSPFIYGINSSTYGYEDIIAYSNRPLSDVNDKDKYRSPNYHIYTTEDYNRQVKELQKNINYDKINRENNKIFEKNVINKYNSLKEIRKISPGIMYLYQKANSVYESPEYCLQRKATIYKKEKNMDLAIECLKKSNELMPYSKCIYQEKDYLKLINYLKLAGRFDEIQQAEEHIRKSLLNVKKEVTFFHFIIYIIRCIFYTF